MSAKSIVLEEAANEEDVESLISSRKQRSIKAAKPDNELIQAFWDAPMSAFFCDVVVSPVVGRSRKTLQCDRWRGIGIPYRKCSGKILYRKSDVIAWVDSHPLINSTSEYKEVRHD